MKFSDVVVCVGAAVILLIASMWVPIVGPFFSLLTPLPFLYYTAKLGTRQGGKFLIVTFLFLGVVSRVLGFTHIIFFLLELGLLGFIISEIFRRRLTFGFTIFWGTALMLLIGAVFLFLIGTSQEMGPVELVLSYLRENLTAAIEAYENMGLEEEQITRLREYGDMVLKVVSQVYPALVIVGTGLVVWVNVVMSKPLFRLGKILYPEFGPLDRWTSQEHLIWGFIASGFALFLPVKDIRFIAVNALIVISVIYVFHGLSIMQFFLNKYRVPYWLKLFAYVLVMFQQVFLVILALAGIFDQWFDFRKLNVKTEIEE